MPKIDQTSAAAQTKDMRAISARQLQELELLYLRTEYRVDLHDSQLILRIGQSDLDLDRFLQKRSATSWAYITAENPGSISLTPFENQQRRLQMESLISTRAWESYPGLGIGEGGYAEKSLLVIGITRMEALELARQFGQLAIVFGEIGKAAELLWY